ncbi:hypothetical protein D3C74_151570 [compost metagenome]
MRNKLLDNSSQLPSARMILIVTNALLFAYRMIITYIDEHMECRCPCLEFCENQAGAVYGGRKIQWLP